MSKGRREPTDGPPRHRSLRPLGDRGLYPSSMITRTSGKGIGEPEHTPMATAQGSWALDNQPTEERKLELDSNLTHARASARTTN